MLVEAIVLRDRARIVGDYLLGRHAVAARPVNLLVETTNRCNLACVMCGSKHIRRKREDMPLWRFRAVVDQAAEWCEVIDLSFSGEPFLHPEVFEQIEYVKRRTSIGLFVETNGMLLDERTRERVFDSGLDYLTVDIDGATADTYRRVRVGGDYERVVANTRRLLRLKRERRSATRVEVAILDLPQTAGEIGEFIDRWRAAGADHVRVKPVKMRLARPPAGPRADEAAGPRADEAAGPRAGSRLGPQGCYLLWREMVVLVDGTVAACCVDQDSTGDSVLGHMDRASLLEIFHGPPACEIRRRHAQGRWRELAFCAGCAPVQPNLLLLPATAVLDALDVKQATSLVDTLAHRLGFRVY